MDEKASAELIKTVDNLFFIFMMAYTYYCSLMHERAIYHTHANKIKSPEYRNNEFL